MGAIWPYIAVVVIVALLFAAERRWPNGVTRLEENFLALLLAVITIVSFSQVVARYGFNSGWTGALEFERILFAWMILFGMGYGIKQGLHLGVDAILRTLPEARLQGLRHLRRLLPLLYAVILLSADWLSIFGANSSGGAIFYWHRLFQIGLGLDDLRYPVWMQHAFGVQERVQRWIAYLMLPIGLALLAFRSLQAMVQIWTGERELVIAGHEAEDLVSENRNLIED